jgi:carbon starvation protein
VLLLQAEQWHIAILAYCFIASLLPLWLLQQPRGYLGGFVLYLALAVGAIGIIFGGFEIRQPAFIQSSGSKLEELIFPFLFVTIACGACSGFHGLVCGGTTSKQIAKESHCKPIGYGAMLLEGLVALIALATVIIVAPGDLGERAPGKLYGDGIAAFISVIFGDEAYVFAATFGAMAFSTFVFDTLDVATRLGRYLLQELFGTQTRLAGVAGSLATAGVSLLILISAQPGSWRQFWVLFGTSNQLLASLTLLGITVWLYREGKRYWYTLLPMVFVFFVTIIALAIQIWVGWIAFRRLGVSFDSAILNGGVAITLLALAMIFLAEAVRSIRRASAGRSADVAPSTA